MYYGAAHRLHMKRSGLYKDKRELRMVTLSVKSECVHVALFLYLYLSFSDYIKKQSGPPSGFLI